MSLADGPWRPEPLAIRIARARGRLTVTEPDRDLALAMICAHPDGPPPELTLPAGDQPTASPPAAVAPAGLPPRGPAGGLALAHALDLDLAELDRRTRRGRPRHEDGPPPVRDYRYLVRAQRGGAVRLIEAPKPRLAEIQRRLLRRVLTELPLHDAAHGAVPGRSVRTALLPHVGSAYVISLDIETFFTVITAPRIAGFLRQLGFHADVASAIAALTTNRTPADVRRGLPAVPGARGLERTWRRDRDLATPHLPQGAPSSPALANRLCWRLDRRLTGLARRRGLRYTRYVDDLLLSAPPGTAVDAPWVVALVSQIVGDEGFRVAAAKTRVQRPAGRQHVLGAVVNDHPTLARRDRDALKATVHNCRVRGWRSQLRDQPADGFREQLYGQVGWLTALDPARGGRLRAELDATDWS